MKSIKLTLCICIMILVGCVSNDIIEIVGDAPVQTDKKWHNFSNQNTASDTSSDRGDTVWDRVYEQRQEQNNKRKADNVESAFKGDPYNYNRYYDYREKIREKIEGGGTYGDIRQDLIDSSDDYDGDGIPSYEDNNDVVRDKLEKYLNGK